MEETDTNVRLEVNELCHQDITPNQSSRKEVKNVAVTAEEITENPEFVVVRKSTAIHAITNEELVIPKQNPTVNGSSKFVIATADGSSNTMEIDFSSQESAMDIASQESISIKDSKSEESHCDNRKLSWQEEAVSAREEAVQKREEAVRKREEAVRKREEAILECEKRLKVREENVAERERILNKREKEAQEYQYVLNIQSKEITDPKLRLKKREAAVQIHELEADGCFPVKLAKKI